MQRYYNNYMENQYYYSFKKSVQKIIILFFNQTLNAFTRFSSHAHKFPTLLYMIS